MESQTVSVGIVQGAKSLSGHLEGEYLLQKTKSVSGSFSAKVVDGRLELILGESVFVSEGELTLTALKNSTFSLENVVVGQNFHWEKREKQTFRGDLVLKLTEGDSLIAINLVDVEEYIKSVVSSEMSPFAPFEFLKAQAIVSRSWLFFRILRKEKERPIQKEGNGEILRIYGDCDHELFHICADDHCQRYHGITKVLSSQVEDAVNETRGLVLVYGSEICDTRYSKCCGGRTDEYSTAWEDRDVPYLASVPDCTENLPPIISEARLARWVTTRPRVFCNPGRKIILPEILAETDLATLDFFRWKVLLKGDELGELVKEKTGFDLGNIKGMRALSRGPSGRIKKLLIEGEKSTLVVGKELEIRRILSKSHLLSSAFLIKEERDKRNRLKSITLLGAGWGHGVGMCQIGAAKMALMGWTYDRILKHYFRGTSLLNIYEKEI